jgi:hypothetical protein
MSEAIKNTQATLPAERPSAEHSAGQKQQWRLAFEKAWLAAASDKKTADSGMPAARSGIDDAVRDSGRAEVQPQSLKALIADGAVSGPAMAICEYPGDCVDFTAELESGRFEQFATKLLGGTGMLVNPNTKEPGVKTLYITRELGQKPEYGVFRDKSLLLLPAGEELQLIIRDAAISTELINRIIQTVRDILHSRGISLARVVVNGAELWHEKTEEAEAASSANSSTDLINRIY